MTYTFRKYSITYITIYRKVHILNKHMESDSSESKEVIF